VEGWCDMDTINVCAAALALDINESKSENLKQLRKANFRLPGGFGLPMKEAKEKVNKLELQQEARKCKTK
jgi:hypothetical protein